MNETSETGDPERLLAEALRAQAARAPQAAKTAWPEPSGKLASEPGALPDPSAGTGKNGAGSSAAAGGVAEKTEPDATTGRDATTDYFAPVPEENTDGMPYRYGLLSGTGAGSLERERAALDSVPTAPAVSTAPTVPTAGTAPEPATLRNRGATAQNVQHAESRQVRAGWVLLLAVLLGLAAGSVIGLLTLL